MLKLGNVLNGMKVMLEQLTETLDTERYLLIENGATQELSEVIDKKTQLLVNLKLLDEERVNIGKLNQIQAPYTEDNFLATQWSDIEQATMQLANINRENGMIMQSRMERTLKKIDFLNKINSTNVYTYGGYMQKELVSKKRAEA